MLHFFILFYFILIIQLFRCGFLFFYFYFYFFQFEGSPIYITRSLRNLIFLQFCQNSNISLISHSKIHIKKISPNKNKISISVSFPRDWLEKNHINLILIKFKLFIYLFYFNTLIFCWCLSLLEPATPAFFH